MTQQAVHRPLWVVLALFVVLATGFNVVVPVFEGADEHTHYFVAQHIARTGQLPVQAMDPESRGPWEQEGSQPPLYYLLVAPLLALTGADLDSGDLWYNHQNTMGQPLLLGNENRFIHPAATEGWPWRGYALAVHLARGISTLMGVLTVVCIWSIARRIFIDREWLSVGVASVVAFNPQVLHLSATFSNDNAMILLAAATLALLLRIMDGHDDRRTIVALALTAGVAPLAKLTGLALLGFTVLTLTGIAASRRDRRPLLRVVTPVIISAAVLSAWWYLRNLQLYGSLTGLNYMLTEGMRRGFRLERWVRGLPGELYGLWLSTWGIFGWFTIMMPSVAYRLITASSLAGLVGAAIAWHGRAAWVRWRRVAWLLLWGGIVFASLLRWMMIAKGGHGRLLFPAISVLATVLVLGWRAIVPYRVADRTVALGFAAVGLGLAVFALAGVIRPAFAMPARIAESSIPESATRVDVLFDERLQLVAIDHPKRALEETWVPITLYWRVLAPIVRDGFVAVRFDQEVGTHLGETDVVPSNVHLSYPGHGNAPPALLEPGNHVYVDQQVVRSPSLESPPVSLSRLPLPGSGEPTTAAGIFAATPGDLRKPIAARLSVHVYDQQAGHAWPAVDPSRRIAVADASSRIVIEPRGAGRARMASGLRASLGGVAPAAVFDNGLKLFLLLPAEEARVADVGDEREQGARALVHRSIPHPSAMAKTKGMPLEAIPLAWLVEGEPEADLALFVHLVGAEGQLLGQYDSPPALNGYYPTSMWQTGEVLAGDLWWELPESVRSGQQLLLLVGLYDPTNGNRVPAYRAGGTRWPDDAVRLVELVVE